MTLRFVALDLGNVLCDLRPEACHEHLAALVGLSGRDVRARFDHESWLLLETGVITAAEFRQNVLKRLGCRLSDELFDVCWNMIPVPRPGADELVQRLRVPHAVWSNTDPIHARHLSGMRVIARAAHCHFSFLARARKPEAGYFARGLDGLGAAPAEVLFIDDREDNLGSAAAMGLVVERAVTLDQAAAALERHQFLDRAPRLP
jgi:putative hydrolase of the HAD superfamily